MTQHEEQKQTAANFRYLSLFIIKTSPIVPALTTASTNHVDYNEGRRSVPASYQYQGYSLRSSDSNRSRTPYVPGIGEDQVGVIAYLFAITENHLV